MFIVPRIRTTCPWRLERVSLCTVSRDTFFFTNPEQEISSVLYNFLSSAFFLHVTEFCDFLDYQSSHRDLDVFFPEECEEHERYSECFGDPTCQKTCENIDRWEMMACARTKICIRGCVCEDGYVRNDRDGCVREINCPRVQTITLQERKRQANTRKRANKTP